jgi:signal transduction histidine kinase
MRLARNLTFSLVLGISIVLAVSAYFRIHREAGLFESDIRRDNHPMGRALAAAVVEVWRTEGEARALRLVADANERESQIDIRWIWLGEGVSDPHRPRLPSSLLGPSAHGAEVAEKIPWDGGEYLVTCIPVPVPGARLGALEVSESLGGQRQYIRATIANTLAATGALTVVCGIISIGLGIWFVGRPMHSLIDQARRIGAGDLSVRLALRQNDEIGELGEEMNGMCERLAAAHEKLDVETSARIAALEQLRHAERLATVGKLASGIAHQLGAPLQIVSGRAQMIADGDLSGEELPRNGRIILEQSRRMTRIIRQLLDFARRPTIQGSKTDLRAIARDACSLVGPLAEKQGVRFALTGQELPAEVKGDEEQLQQALTNLLINGMQAMPRGGVITVGVARERARPPADHGGGEGDYLLLSVEDEGVGMDPQTMAHVFEPFFTTKPVGEGTGLGLSVAYGIVHEHGGWIRVDSRPGAGSRFSLYFPEDPRS